MTFYQKDSPSSQTHLSASVESYLSTQSQESLLQEDSSPSFLRDKTKNQQNDWLKNHSRRNKTRKRKPGNDSGYIKTLLSASVESSSSTKPPNPLLQEDSSQAFLRDKTKNQQNDWLKNHSRRNKTRNRKPGEGSGYIKTIERVKKGKLYKEHWYQWEIWSNGKPKRGTTYISQKKLDLCRSMDASKEPVNKILCYLQTNKKRSKY